MLPSTQRRILLAAVLLLAFFVFVTGIQWGLPSRAVDPYLFGDHPVWTGEQILALKGERSKSNARGADVDENPIVDRTQPVWLNETDQQRAEIVLRYRLYSYQPDEMNTLMALASMKPGAGDFDPKMYKYGGLWVYPVGAMLKIAGMLKLIHLTPDLAYYLDHPEAFGRFYIVARLYTVMWGVVGAWAIFWIASRLSSNNAWIAASAAVCFIFMPVVVTMAHEAKPHLPGAVLTLLAIIAAAKFVERGQWRWAIATGAICGAAVGMVLSAWVAFAVIPVMLVMRRPDAIGKRIALGLAATVLGVFVYFATNPYVAIHLINNCELLRANLGNSAAFYHFSLASAGILNAIRLILEGTSPVLAVAGLAAMATIFVWNIALRVRLRKSCHPERTREGSGVVADEARSFGVPQDDKWSVAWLLAIPATIALAQFIAFAIDQPMDYGRFALLPDIIITLGGIGLASLLSNWRRNVVLGVLVIMTAGAGVRYLTNFISDCSTTPSRLHEATKMASVEDEIIGVYSEPAPYCLPPLNVFRFKLLLVPRGSITRDARTIWATDSEMTWANKSFESTSLY